jgi:hypothetical protein
LIIASATIFSTCKKGGLGCTNTVYNFKIPESITPDKDSIKTGDTLFLNVSTSSNLSDLQTGIVVNYSNTENLGNVVTLLRFSPMNMTAGAINNFNFHLLNGREVNAVDPLSQKDVLFAENNGDYIFSLAIIAKDTGRYALTIGDAANVYRKNDKCTKAGFAINFGNTDQHFYFLKEWRPDLTLDNNGKRHVYYFKVY